jgi:predicted acetyltransferase
MKSSKNSKITPQFITNDKGEKVSVILPIKQYLKLLDAIEDNEDIRLYDEVKSRNEKRFSLDEYLKGRKITNAKL